MTLFKVGSLVLLTGCTVLVIFGSTHPHDVSGNWISHGSLLPRAQHVLSKAMAGDGDSLISVWYHSDLLIGYLGESDLGVLALVSIEKALRVKTPEFDGFKQEIVVRNPADPTGYRYLGIVSDGTPDMRSRLVLGMQVLDSVPATVLDSYCQVGSCTANATYSSQIWHVNRAAREVIPAFTNENMETDLGIVFERKWTGDLHLALKDVNSETRLILVPAQDRSHRTL